MWVIFRVHVVAERVLVPSDDCVSERQLLKRGVKVQFVRDGEKEDGGRTAGRSGVLVARVVVIVIATVFVVLLLLLVVLIVLQILVVTIVI